MADIEEEEYASSDSGSEAEDEFTGRVAKKVPKKPLKEDEDIDPEEENLDEDLDEDLLLDDEEDDDDEKDDDSIIDAPFATGNANANVFLDIDDDDEEEEEDEHYLQKFAEDQQKNIIRDYHPELKVHSVDEINARCKIVKDEKGNVIDPFHKTLSFVTKYEKARVLGERAKQINAGAEPFVEIEDSLIDGYLIALKEYEAKKIPFIIQRPLPNGDCEYWRLKDLEII